jgi:hypothetical protein
MTKRLPKSKPVDDTTRAAQVRELSLKGFDLHEIAGMLDMPAERVRVYGEESRDQCAVVGATRGLAAPRGECIAALRLHLKSLHVELQNCGDARVRLRLFGMVRETLMSLALVNGLSPRAIERHLAASQQTSEGARDLMKRIERQDASTAKVIQLFDLGRKLLKARDVEAA